MIKTFIYNRLQIDISATKKLFLPRNIMASITETRNRNTILKKLFLKSIASVQPTTLIRKHVKILNCHLVVGNRSFPLDKPCHMVGFGKAVLGMAKEMEKTLDGRLKRAIVTVPKGIFEKYPDVLRNPCEKIEFIEGAENNIPDEEAMEGAVKIKELVEALKADDLLIVLISGGGSALLPLPITPITLEEKQALIKELSRAGAGIRELNTVRKHLSVLKGGGLAKLAYPCRVVSLVLSDVVGDPLDMIASGPTVYNEESPEKAIAILKNYHLYEQTPHSIKSILENRGTRGNQSNDGKAVTLPGNGNFEHVSNFIIGNNKIATLAAKNLAIKNGLQCVVMSHEVEVNVDKLARMYAELAREIVAAMENNGNELEEFLRTFPVRIEEEVVREVLELDFSKKILLIFAGEPTVLVLGTGRGGRNQQLALAFSTELNKLRVKSGNISFLSGGTDGIDGPTDAAGAVAISDLEGNCSGLDINPSEYLANNDSNGFFEKFRNGECLVKVGHTGTNVMDIHLLMFGPE